jgi:hypothetical protein
MHIRRGSYRICDVLPPLLLLLLPSPASGLVCPKGFPAAFGSFPALESLMLRYNDFNGDTLTRVSEVRC